ncbi:MAG: PilZ domain-containing protein [Spirochaetales bacterium]|nr:PilZ domain-containing protein [Spirochaetales bacterium]
MSITTSQQIQRFYSQYKDTEVTFTKEIIRAIRLIPSQVYFKSLGHHWPCIIYSTSMTQTRIIATLNESFYEQAKKSGNIIQIRYAFQHESKSNPFTYFIAAKVTGFSPYGKTDKDINFISASYTQRPPDSFIDVIGTILDANVSSAQRKEERVVVTPDVAEMIGLKAKETMVFIDQVPRKCLIRDISFGGAKIILMGIGKFLVNKPAAIRLFFDEAVSFTEINGSITRCEEVSGRKDITALAIKFDDKVPMQYKLKLNEFFKRQKVRKLVIREAPADDHKNNPGPAPKNTPDPTGM